MLTKYEDERYVSDTYSRAAADLGVSGEEILITDAVMKAAYSCFTGTNEPYIVTEGTASVEWNERNITNDPLFAATGDVHLRSRGGRWDNAVQEWVEDDDISPCIDAGDPEDAVGDETRPNGNRINMGAYGRTARASRTWKQPRSIISIY